MRNSPMLFEQFSIATALAGFGVTLENDKDIAELTTANLVNDTRELEANDIFCAVVGHEQDGRAFIETAIVNGAALVLAQCQHSQQHGNITWRKSHEKPVAVIQFYQLDRHLFALAKSYYGCPQDKLKMIGITGTNGKTSTCQLVAKLLDASDKQCAVIGTNGFGRLNQLIALGNTTPGPTKLHRLLSEFVQDDVSHVAMEVSSHGLSQGRVCADLLDVAVFTNLSRDHLDYHHTMEDYAQAKWKIFTGNAKQLAILNGDDDCAAQWLKDWPSEQPVIVYGFGEHISQYSRYVKANNILHLLHGVEFELETDCGSIKICSPLMGDFNVSNLLAAISVALVEKISLKNIAQAITTMTPIDGRMEAFSQENKTTTVVDYAHTPDGLLQALAACRQHCNGQLWVVFGCGGDRDKGKRALMGKIAEQHAQHVIITNDNPRTEMPEMIVRDILAGCENPEKIAVMLNRQQAVTSAITHAGCDDIVLLAGKGHEDYIILGTEKHYYNEREIVRQQYQQEAIS
ncbi:UDP-N-acetylmuramoyl-L-alanyl-D-glutamate--2,6-diaminopimelate ligase [Colwelliaceae bacterium 6471]